MIGLGLYEANAIQFALNQMVEASSEQLSSFIYWYIWCTNVAPLFMYYFSVGTIYSLNCKIEVKEIDHGVHPFYFPFNSHQFKSCFNTCTVQSLLCTLLPEISLH